MTDQQSPASRFPISISRRLSLIIAGCVAAYLAVGGITVVLSLHISRVHRLVDQERVHIDAAEDISLALHQLVFELQHLQFTGKRSETDLLTLHGKLARALRQFREYHAGEEEQIRGNPEIRPRLAWFEECVGRLLPMVMPLQGQTSPTARLSPADLQSVADIAHQLPDRFRDLGATHEARITRLLDSSRKYERAVIALFIITVSAGCLMVLIAWRRFHRFIAAPIQALSSAATSIAEGRLGERVPVGRPDEIGQLSHAFNAMAERLQRHDHDLHDSQARLERKVQEVQALYAITTEILALRDLDTILGLVTEKARLLLDAESSAVCLLTPGRDGLAVRSTSGSGDLFQARDGAVCRSPECLSGQGCCLADCPVLRTERVRSHHAAPLRRGDDSVGVLCVASREARQFEPAQIDLLSGLASQAAIAIENARLLDEIGKLAVADERGRIARELHDGLAQTVSLLHLRIRQAQAMIPPEQRGRIGNALEEMAAISASAYDEIRRSLYGLRTMVSEGLGLIPNLVELLHEFSVQSEVPVKLEAGGAEEIRLDPGPEFQLIRIVQEALANIRKHAHATQAWVRVSREAGWVRVSVEDDGRGFDPATLATPSRMHFGLRGMRERAEGLGGKLEIVTSPGHGTRVTAVLPLESA